MDAEYSKTLAGQVKQISKLRHDVTMKNKKKKESGVLNKKICERLESALRTSKEREVGLKAKAISMQEAIDNGSK